MIRFVHSLHENTRSPCIRSESDWCTKAGVFVPFHTQTKGKRHKRRTYTHIFTREKRQISTPLCWLRSLTLSPFAVCVCVFLCVGCCFLCSFVLSSSWYAYEYRSLYSVGFFSVLFTLSACFLLLFWGYEDVSGVRCKSCCAYDWICVIIVRFDGWMDGW